MQQLGNLTAITAECDRVVNGMLDGSMTRDDGLFAATAALQKVSHELVQFVSYALPLLHTIDQAVRAAAAQAAQAQAAQAQAAQAQAAQAAQAAPMQAAQPQVVVPIGMAPSGDVQVVDGTPRTRAK